MKEQLIEERLAHWLSANGCDVFYNRKIGTLGNKNVFTTKGETSERPDMIIFTKQIGFVAIEIKDGDEDRKIYDGNKILEYQKQYIEGKIKYYIKDSIIPIAAFIVASQNSVNGKLFSKDELTRENSDGWVRHPKIEYQKTAAYTRSLWGGWRNKRKKGDAGIGVLLSGVLDKIETRPMIFCQLYYNNRWNVTWTIL